MRRAYGFTIVELLIVIVVVAILAALSYVGYANISARARDSIRQQDMATIKKALLAYDVEHGGVMRTSSIPRYNPDTALRGNWDASVDAGWLAFLHSSYGKMPTDPVNLLGGGNSDPSLEGYGHKVYSYHCYTTGPSGPYVVIGYHNESGSRVVERFEVTVCL